jgi:hypothetical protein
MAAVNRFLKDIFPMGGPINKRSFVEFLTAHIRGAEGKCPRRCAPPEGNNGGLKISFY